MEWVDNLAASLGVQTSMVTALLALIASVPASHLLFFMQSPELRHVYSIVAGASLCWFAYGGWDALLRLAAICVYTYICISVFPRKFSGTFNAITCFLILISLHIQNYQSDKWREGGMDYTGTLMVFVLKLVSLGLDYQDGGLPPDKASLPKYRNKLYHMPSFLSFMSFMFFPASLLFGPVSVYHDYITFIEGKGVWSLSPGAVPAGDADASSAPLLTDEKAAERAPQSNQSPATGSSAGARSMPYPLPAALLSFISGVVWLGITFVARQNFPSDFMTTTRFFELNIVQRLSFLIATSITTRGQFYCVWGIAGSAMIASGFAFNGWKEEKEGGKAKPDWTHLQQCSAYMVELGTSMAQVVNYWNMSVSAWLRTYVYDRLTPPNGKPTAMTLVITQAVSAFWHGWQPGYYLCFISAAMSQHSTKMIFQFMRAQGKASSTSHDIFQRVLKQFLLAYSVAGFLLLTFKDTIAVWRSVYFFGSIFPLAVIFLLPLVKPAKRRSKAE